MPRVKRGILHSKRRKNLLKSVKGYKWGRKNKIKLAKVAIVKAGASAYRDRRKKKRDFRALWNIKINAALRARRTTYSRFMGHVKDKNFEIDRKILSQLAQDHPKIFDKIVERVVSGR